MAVSRVNGGSGGSVVIISLFIEAGLFDVDVRGFDSPETVPYYPWKRYAEEIGAGGARYGSET
jgi:hypothetical protein